MLARENLSGRADESSRETEPMSSEREARSSADVCQVNLRSREGRGMEESGEVKAERLQWDDVRGRTFCLLIGSSLAPVPLL